jgi:hypothetical protein
MGDVANEIKEGLLEDSLKMPFTVFSTKQKKTMIKWLEDLRGTPLNQSQPNNRELSGNVVILSVIDFENGRITLMSDETGDTFDNVPIDGDLGVSMKKAFEETDGCLSVEAQKSPKGQTIQKVIRLITE